MELVADRFAVTDGEGAIDLATGRRVALVVSTAGARPEHARWAARCARLAAVWHMRLAPLVDYGAVGDVRRFEAWQCDGAWDGPAAEAESAVECGGAFLRANGLTGGECGAGSARRLRGRAVYVPPPTAGYECEATCPVGIALPEASERFGLTILPRATISAITDRFSSIGTGRGTALAVWGAQGAGIQTAVLDLARAARVQGFIPVSPAALVPSVWPLLRGRSLCIIARRGADEGWRALLELSMHTGKPHLLIFAGSEDVPGVQPVMLERFSAEALAGAVRPRPTTSSSKHLVDTAARRAHGLPGLFADLLWPRAVAPVDSHPDGLRAAEQADPYGNGLPECDGGSLPDGAEASWPVPGDLVTLRRRMAGASKLLDAGHHAGGERVLRQVVGGLTRRRDWAASAQGMVALARALLLRGRQREAQVTIAEARQCAVRAGDVHLMLRLAILSGRAAVDGLHLDEAEATLHAAMASARGVGDDEGVGEASIELARCLTWRGRWDAAGALLSSIAAEGLGPERAVRLAALASRVALGRTDLQAAVAGAASAAALAARDGRPALEGGAAYAAAMAHLAVGDAQALAGDVCRCLNAARAAHDPLLAARARLVGAEGERRLGRRAQAARLVSRLRRIGDRRVPAIVRARVDLLADLLRDDGPGVTERHARATGLAGLSLFGPPARANPQRAAADLLDILRCCQEADEDTNILAALSARLRALLDAAAVACFVDEDGRLTQVASDGGRIDASAAVRIQAGGDLDTARALGGLEGGVTVRYGGRVIGVLAIRWRDAWSCESPTLATVLSTAAIAAGPALAGVLLGRTRPPSGCPELLGASGAIDAVRGAIDRSARAPFSVLIEGESGSGKELVARALHRRGLRRDGPCCTLNCAALPDDLVESELFGHARGAFTGAVAERQGVFEAAHLGTLFLDEVGELSLRAQAKVLRAIQEGEIRRVGENTARRVDVRLVAATNRDLRKEAAAGRFRLDLLYRLDVIRILVPPLRDRREDIPILAEHFWRDAASRVGSRATLGVATLGALARYDWPGNVRELQNVLAALAVRSPRRGVIPPSALSMAVDGTHTDRSGRLDHARRAFDASFIRSALARAGGGRTQAAEELGVSRQGLTKLMARLGLRDVDVPSSTSD